MFHLYVDPGHGTVKPSGVDYGAVGINSVKEAPIVLKISKLLKEELTRCGFKVSMSREGDSTTKDLEARSNEANALKVDSFVSLHCNWSESSQPVGTQTYIYKFGGEAEKIASKVQGRLQPMNGVSKWERVESENFYVLRKTNMPAILIELGFLTNKADCEALTSPEKQKWFAKEICKALCEYYKVSYKEESTMDYEGHWGEEAIQEMIDKKIMVGDGKGNFRPDDLPTRAELAQALSNTLKYLGK